MNKGQVFIFSLLICFAIGDESVPEGSLTTSLNADNFD